MTDLRDPVSASQGGGSDEPRWTLAIGALLAAGVLARLWSYLANRSLWLDEAMIALNIERRSYAELFGTLDFNQAAPLGFLWLEKAAVQVMGASEYALRLWPLLAGIGALFLFNELSRRFLAGWPRFLAFALFSLSTALVYFSTEVKQYSFDVFWVLLVLLVALRDDEDGSPWALVAVGALGVWFSHPLVFVLPGVLVYRRLAGQATRDLLGTAAIWGLSFAAAYWFTARGASQNPAMGQFWAEGFMPLLPRSAEAWAWYPEAISGWMRIALDFSDRVTLMRTVGIWSGVGLAVWGLVRLWQRDRRLFVLVAAPLLLAIAASALQLYPFRGRLLLFLVPTTLLFVGFGSERHDAGESSGPLARWALVPGAFCLATVVGVLVPWLGAPVREELRDVMTGVAERAEPGDRVYIHSGALHASLFYERVCPECRFETAEVVRGRLLFGEDAAIAEEAERLRSPGRVWALFSHEWWGVGDLERDRLVAALGGSETPAIEAPGAEAFLLEFGGDAAAMERDPRIDALAEAGARGQLAAVEAAATALAQEAWDAGDAERAHWLALRPAYLWLYGPRDVDQAVAAAEAALDRFPFDMETPVSGLVLADFFVRAGQADRARAFRERWAPSVAVEQPNGPMTRVDALLDLSRGNLNGAVGRLRSGAARADGCDMCAEFDLAVAYEAAGARDSATAAFQRAIGASDAPRSPAGHIVPYAFERIGTMAAADTSGADSATLGRDAIRSLLELWSGADAVYGPARARVEAVLAELEPSGD